MISVESGSNMKELEGTLKRLHTGENLYQCDQFDKSFTQSGNLKVHKRTHTGERPFKCSQCGKSFTQAGHLKEHEGTHTLARPFECNQCGQSFRRARALKQHACKLTHSTEKESLECNKYGKRFEQSLEQHGREHKEDTGIESDQVETSIAQPGSVQEEMNGENATGELFECTQSQQSCN